MNAISPNFKRRCLLLALCTVPGSPGMDTPAYAGKKIPYNVMLIAKDGGATVYQKYEGNNQ